MEDLLTYTTRNGTTLSLRRVAQRHVARILAKHPIPDPPTYTFKAAGGAEVTQTHDETTLETPEDHKAWNIYLKERAKANSEQNLAVIRFLIYQCIADDPPPPEQWSINFDLWGLEPPDTSDPISYKVEWLESEVATDPDDYSALISRLYQLGGLLKEEHVEDFEKFFRATLARLGSL